MLGGLLEFVGGLGGFRGFGGLGGEGGVWFRGLGVWELLEFRGLEVEGASFGIATPWLETRSN